MIQPQSHKPLMFVMNTTDLDDLVKIRKRLIPATVKILTRTYDPITCLGSCLPGLSSNSCPFQLKHFISLALCNVSSPHLGFSFDFAIPFSLIQPFHPPVTSQNNPLASNDHTI